VISWQKPDLNIRRYDIAGSESISKDPKQVSLDNIQHKVHMKILSTKKKKKKPGTSTDWAIFHCVPGGGGGGGGGGGAENQKRCTPIFLPFG